MNEVSFLNIFAPPPFKIIFFPQIHDLKNSGFLKVSEDRTNYKEVLILVV